MIRRPLADHGHGVRQAKEERRPSDDEASRDALLPRRNSSKRGGMSSAPSVRKTQTFNEKDYAAADLHSRKEPVFDF